MNTTYVTIIAFILALVVIVSLLALIFIRQKRAEHLHDHFGSEYDLAVQNQGTGECLKAG